MLSLFELYLLLNFDILCLYESILSVFLIASCPGRYIANKNNYGHLKLRNVSVC